MYAWSFASARSRRASSTRGACGSEPLALHFLTSLATRERAFDTLLGNPHYRPLPIRGGEGALQRDGRLPSTTECQAEAYKVEEAALAGGTHNTSRTLMSGCCGPAAP